MRTSHTTRIHKHRKRIVGLTPTDVTKAMEKAAREQPDDIEPGRWLGRFKRGKKK